MYLIGSAVGGGAFYHQFTTPIPDALLIPLLTAIGKQLPMTRGTLTTFSIANDAANYFAIVLALFILAVPGLRALNVMGLHSPQSVICGH